MNAAEDRLSELMDAATCALDPPINDILAAGERLGRARKRRRHIAVAAGTAAVVLLAGAGVAVGVGDPEFAGDYDAAGHVTGPSHQAAQIPDTRAPATLESPTANPTTADLFGFDTVPPKPGEVPINATAAVNILRKLVAANWKFGAYKPSSTRSLLQVDVDDGKGLSEISVTIAPVGTSYVSPVDCAKQGFSGAATPSSNPDGFSPTSDPAAAKGIAPAKSECYVAGYDTGDRVMLEVLTSPQSNVVIDRVVANRSDGVAIEIMAWNGDPTSAYDHVTRAWPPLDVERWAYIAVSRMWQPYVSASLAK